MIKLSKLIIKENFGGPGKMVLPANHKAGMRVTKGGSCCANCLFWDTEKEVCTNEYYIKWAGTNTIPYAADEYCTNWWEPVPVKSEEEPASKEGGEVEETTYHTLGLKQVRVVIEGDDVEKQHAKIIKLLDDLDPEHTLKYFPATAKIVGNFAQVKAQDKKGISLAQKRINDNKIKATIYVKPQTIK
jgi:hypothetical protein